MNHIAIMRKSWGLAEKILTGEKTIESRWYETRRAPWGKIKKGDIVYLKLFNSPILPKNLNGSKQKDIVFLCF